LGSGACFCRHDPILMDVHHRQYGNVASFCVMMILVD
jgi:hypothetical protein